MVQQVEISNGNEERPLGRLKVFLNCIMIKQKHWRKRRSRNDSVIVMDDENILCYVE